MPVLGIETSCDETGVALVEHGRLLAQKLATQEELHGLFGGVVPEMASREHLRLLPRLYDALLKDTGLASTDIEAVAVSRGPGLLGALLVGVSFAKGLGLATGARLIGVNHLHAHLLAAGLERELAFPALGLLVSGGHTHTYAINGPDDFELLGRTLDDAAGEALDKAAKHMNLPYPGGRHVDRLAGLLPEGEAIDTTLFPRAFVDTPSLDFSFSGLKTAVCGHLDAHPDLRFDCPDQGLDEQGRAKPDAARSRVCASLNWAVADTLRIKVERALAFMEKQSAMDKAASDGQGGTGRARSLAPKSLIVAGGVAANSMVREAMAKLAEDRGLELILPSKGLCTDNAAMVAHAGWLLHRAGLGHGLDLEAVPRGRTVPRDYLSFP